MLPPWRRLRISPQLYPPETLQAYNYTHATTAALGEPFMSARIVGEVLNPEVKAALDQMLGLTPAPTAKSGALPPAAAATFAHVAPIITSMSVLQPLAMIVVALALVSGGRSWVQRRAGRRASGTSRWLTKTPDV